MSTKVNYSSVEERDMDTLFLEAFSTDEGFLQLFLNEIDEIKEKSFEVESVELSKTDRDGESDITVIIKNEKTKIGLLIEDKINAKAMTEQCSRYTKRGNTGMKNGDYKKFYVFIVAPEKYYNNDDEAKKYDHYVSYEKCREYLKSKDDAMAKIWIQQIDQAIEKVKRTNPVVVAKHRVEVFKKYLAYQEHYFPKLKCRTNLDNVTKAGWVQFAATPKNAYIMHKTDKGQFDLTFDGTSEKRSTFKLLEEYIHKMGFPEVQVVETGKSMTFRINVTPIDFNDEFEKIDKKVLDECFTAGYKLNDLADIISFFAEICK